MVYGDQLAFFTEQFRTFEYFEMQPQPVASYDKRKPLGIVKGVFQFAKRGELKRENDTLEDTNVPTLWTRQELKVGNTFIKKGDEIFRIVNPADWLFEGGFCVYILETFVGNAEGKQEPFDYVDLGQNSYA